MRTSLFKTGLLAVLAILLSVQLSGCSFQLRGSDGEFANTQLQLISLRAEPDADSGIKSGIAELLPKTIDLLSVQTVVPLTNASNEQMAQEVFLVLSSTQKQNKRTAISVVGETTAEFIRWVQPYQVLNLKGEVLFSDEAFAYRDRQMDPQGLMAANQELYEINQQMANEIAEQIVRRIQFMATPR